MGRIIYSAYTKSTMPKLQKRSEKPKGSSQPETLNG
jgi:hypothetical protein